jgi:dipeptidyl aminopeptidase/acylaminoacyl peptidase
MRTFIILGMAIGAMLASASVSANKAATSSPTLDKMLSLKTVRSTEISPDGRYVAYSVFENDFKADKDMSQLWVVSTDGGTPLQLTYGEDAVGEFEWSADSKWIAFVRKGKLGFIRAAGGEAIMPKFDVKGFSRLRFSPDGRSLYYVSGPGDKALIEAREERYGKYNVVREDGGYNHIWRATLTDDMKIDGKPEQLTHGRDYTVSGYSLSPDGSKIAFGTWPSPHLAELLKGRIYVISTEEGTPTLIDDSYGGKSTPIWHQNSRTLAYANGVSFPEYSNIVIRDADGKNLRTLEMPDHDAWLVWFDDNGLLFNAGVRTNQLLFNMNVDTGKISQISEANTFERSFTFSADGTTHAFVSSTPSSLNEISVGSRADSRTLTSFSDQIEGTSLPTKELITWKSDNGLEIEGILTKPAGYKRGKRYPLYVRTHGGPTGTDRPLLSGPRSIYHPEVLAAEGDGAFVLQTNYRGSASYGNAFQTSNLKNLGIGPARDIIAGVEMLIDQGLVDPKQVACLGWSQGGHISAMLATYSDVCTAAIMGAGISDWRTYYYNTDITQFTTEYFKATPLADDDVYAKTSPVTYIDSAKTPVLIQHGENDQRVPIANGYQLRQLLLDKGVESRMIVYADMGHGPSTPRTRRAITEHALAWFREYLFGDKKPDFVHPVPPKAKSENEGGESDEKTED